MNREIKFRAWDKEHEIMTNSPVNKLNFAGQIHLHSGWADVEDTCYELMQYTGLKDKNGKEIYEGDILKDDVGELFEVKFGKLPLDKSGDCVCTYHAFYAKGYGKLGRAPSYECNHIGEWMEVIGNIYENPELLEKEAV